MKNKLAKRAFIGFLTGIAIGQIISVIISLSLKTGEFVVCADEFVEVIGNQAAAAAIQTLLCGILGSGFSTLSVVWEMDNLNIALQSGICLGGYSLILFPIAYFTNWMEHSLGGFLSYAAIFLSTFILIWIIRYISWKNKVTRINKMINKE